MYFRAISSMCVNIELLFQTKERYLNKNVPNNFSTLTKTYLRHNFKIQCKKPNFDKIGSGKES